MKRIFPVFLLAIAVVGCKDKNSHQIESSAAILYYNAPAAVLDGDEIAVGYVDNAGDVRVSRLSLDGEVTSKTTIHSYGKPDDHAAPALHVVPDGVLVATAFHSTDLMLYLLSGNNVTLLCTWRGSYSYPRFDEVDGQLRLYMRSAPEDAGNLVYFDNPTDCGAPTTVATSAYNEFIYAPPPVAGNVTWGTYSRVTDIHSRPVLNGQKIKTDSELPQVLPWSLGYGYLALTHFSKSYGCCGKGEFVATLLHEGKRIRSLPPQPMPYYADGFVIRPDGKEAISPEKKGPTRISLPEQKELPSCAANSGYNGNAQYVSGLDGAYVWLSMKAPFSGKNLKNINLWLCLPDKT